MSLLLWVGAHPWAATAVLCIAAVTLAAAVVAAMEHVVLPVARFLWPRSRHRRTLASRLRDRRAEQPMDPHPDVPAPYALEVPPRPDVPPPGHVWIAPAEHDPNAQTTELRQVEETAA